MNVYPSHCCNLKHTKLGSQGPNYLEKEFHVLKPNQYSINLLSIL